MPVVPDQIDLTTVKAVCDYLQKGESPTIVAVIQPMVTGASRMFLSRIGVSSLDSVNSYDEFYDGNGSNTLFLDQVPIVSVSCVKVNARTLQPSTTVSSPGWVIDRTRKSIVFRLGGVAGGPITFGTYTASQNGYQIVGAFSRGIQNVEVVYTAGYTAIPADIVDKVTQLVAVNYQRRNWVDQESQNLSGTGATAFHKWIWPPEVEECLDRYQRRARP
jgi:hypothetical protein